MDELNIITPERHFDNELTIPSVPFDFNNPPFDPAEFAMALSEKMVKSGTGVGLAAVQVGVHSRIFAVRTDPIVVCFNPKIVDATGDMQIYSEGCLSFPGMTCKVKRVPNIRLRFQTHEGKFITRKFEGLAARVVQHEHDHCEGILFFERANPYHRQQAFKSWEKAKRARAINTPKEELSREPAGS